MKKFNLPLTYEPKIQPVIDGTCRQTIRNATLDDAIKAINASPPDCIQGEDIEQLNGDQYAWTIRSIENTLHFLRTPTQEQLETCRWVANSDGVYETACGNMWEFIDGSPSDNGVLFCPFCSKGIITQKEHQ